MAVKGFYIIDHPHRVDDYTDDTDNYREVGGYLVKRAVAGGTGRDLGDLVDILLDKVIDEKDGSKDGNQPILPKAEVKSEPGI